MRSSLVSHSRRIQIWTFACRYNTRFEKTSYIAQSNLLNSWTRHEKYKKAMQFCDDPATISRRVTDPDNVGVSPDVRTTISLPRPNHHGSRPHNLCPLLPLIPHHPSPPYPHPPPYPPCSRSHSTCTVTRPSPPQFSQSTSPPPPQRSHVRVWSTNVPRCSTTPSPRHTGHLTWHPSSQTWQFCSCGTLPGGPERGSRQLLHCGIVGWGSWRTCEGEGQFDLEEHWKMEGSRNLTLLA
ncbi:hypothetical protein K491DRAFT_272317 [Lophiostoma macrostomum CBS 122681]|uniref:Uncharacterized protein n=1 Tax=Lophiostoma macrostomum CBS 122681 TaxID=1314788 RepID=A0A6A6SKF0_9PLEO|nr:hypothetical protein K491DRAFT_272317 [Lophiostoma macrostomum CBS 122681]